MISIVVCHRSPAFLAKFKQSISNTIGVHYEMVIINNTTNRYNICQAYNQGIKQSKYGIICFAHEDLIFLTEDWGKNVIEHFKNPKLGIIGVVGSYYLPKLPSSHWSSGTSIGSIIPTTDEKKQYYLCRKSLRNKPTMQAVLLDGLWLCISKTVFEKVSFDDVTFSGFHCYDSDICLQIRKSGYEVKIVFDIIIGHFSLGKRDRAWLKNIFYLHDKWKRELPLYTIKLSKSQVSLANFLNAKELIEQIQINKAGLLYTIKTWLYYLRCNPLITKMNWLLALRLFNEKLFFLLLNIKDER